jgi:hypothetical protein
MTSRMPQKGAGGKEGCREQDCFLSSEWSMTGVKPLGAAYGESTAREGGVPSDT